ncbi:MAG: hypothetical protein M4D80_40815 [Myxococcota bacterium]|nr:hypothetical protein [Deltaproteobacteria bacterium]MDQ3341536.1 hypothetical protein [Myxococcota bacterium]
MRKLACLVILAACGGDSSSKTALFELPGDSTDFYALPFPNDLRREADGTIDLSGFPTNSLIADKYREAADTLEGFGLNQAVFARFDGTLDSPTLPDPLGSVADTASVYLVDIDPDSPQRGERTPIAVKFRAEATRTLGGNHLVARPYPGFGLAEGTTYALVITDRVGGVKASPTFEALLGTGGDAKTVEARTTYQPLLDWLAEPGGDDRDDLVSAAVFTTQRVTQIVPALRKGVLAAPAPVATGITPGPVTAAMSVFTGQYMAPNFQSGDVPYRDAPTGQIMVAGDTAISQRLEPMRFGLTIPAGPVPANGFPIAIYAHGTGGDHLSFVDDGTGAALAAQGIAMISTDQVLHGPRNPNGDEQIDFFNVANPFAMRDNSLQGTADAFAQLRLAQGMSFADGGRTIRFDATKVYFFGHSQGGLTGPGFVAFEPSLSGAVFSGTGGLLYLGLLYKTKPLDVSMLLATFLRDDPVDEDNPSLAMVQMWVERADGANYAPMFVRRPIGTPRNIFQTEGFTDTYTPNPSIEAFAIATGGDIVQLADTADITGLTALRGRTVKAAPIATNVNGATAALGQYKQRTGSDGHFVVFDIAVAKRQAASFLGTLAQTGTATVVP